MKLTKLYLENIRTFIKRNYRKDADIDKKIALWLIWIKVFTKNYPNVTIWPLLILKAIGREGRNKKWVD